VGIRQGAASDNRSPLVRVPSLFASLRVQFPLHTLIEVRNCFLGLYVEFYKASLPSIPSPNPPIFTIPRSAPVARPSRETVCQDRDNSGGIGIARGRLGGCRTIYAMECPERWCRPPIVAFVLLLSEGEWLGCIKGEQDMCWEVRSDMQPTGLLPPNKKRHSSKGCASNAHGFAEFR
jgi:hypothetical protein